MGCWDSEPCKKYSQTEKGQLDQHSLFGAFSEPFRGLFRAFSEPVQLRSTRGTRWRGRTQLGAKVYSRKPGSALLHRAAGAPRRIPALHVGAGKAQQQQCEKRSPPRTTAQRKLQVEEKTGVKTQIQQGRKENWPRPSSRPRGSPVPDPGRTNPRPGLFWLTRIPPSRPTQSRSRLLLPVEREVPAFF